MLSCLAEEQPHPVVVKLAVSEMPTSGKPAELLHAAGIDADCIADAARSLAARITNESRDEVGSGRRE